MRLQQVTMHKTFTRTPLLKLIVCTTLLIVCGINNNAYSVTVNIAQPFNDTLLCLGQSIDVYISSNDSFDANNNVFKIELSDNNGSFSNPTVIGTWFDFQANYVPCIIPLNTTPGTGYRIRVTSSHPAYTSSNNGKDIRISAKPTSTLTNNGPLCVGKMLQLNATSSSSNHSFSWTGPNGFTSNIANPSKNTTVFADSGYYKVTTTSYNCSSTDSTRVIIRPAPSVSQLTNPSPVCQSGKYTMSMACNICSDIWNPNLYIYKIKPNGDTLGGVNMPATQTHTDQNINIKDSGAYRIVINFNGCTLDTGFYVKIKPTPDTPVGTSNSPLCVGDTLLLSGTSSTQGVTYRWEGPNGFVANTNNASRPNIQNGDAGNYYFYASKNGCDSRPDTVAVDVGIPLAPLPIKGDSLLCPGNRLSLAAQTTVTSGILWYKLPNLNIPISTNRTYGVPNSEASDAGTYAVTQEVNGCRAPLSTVTVVIPDIKKPDAGNNGPLCLGETLKLTAVPSAGGSYEWTGPSGFSSTDAAPEISNVNYSHEGTYSITTTLGICSLGSTTEVIIKPMPEISDISSNSPVCTYTQLLLQAQSSLPNSTFEWTGPRSFVSNEQNPSIFFEDDRSGIYRVVATADGCTSEPMSVEVAVKEGPGISTVSNNGPLKAGERLLLQSDNDKPGVTFIWEGPDGFSSDKADPVIDEVTYRNAGEYTLTTVYNDCSTTVSTIVDIENISGITAELFPNPNDGKFTVRGITQSDATLDVIIYNQLGRVVYRGEVTPDRSIYESVIDIKGSSTGVYLIHLVNNTDEKLLPFAIVKQ